MRMLLAVLSLAAMLVGCIAKDVESKSTSRDGVYTVSHIRVDSTTEVLEVFYPGYVARCVLVTSNIDTSMGCWR